MAKETTEAKKSDGKEAGKGEGDKTQKDEMGRPLTESDIKLLRRYGKGPYTDALKKSEAEVKELNQKITEMCGVKESDTGLALPASWNLEMDKQMMKQEHPLQVGRCTKIM